jgi:hypothetical protein
MQKERAIPRTKRWEDSPEKIYRREGVGVCAVRDRGRDEARLEGLKVRNAPYTRHFLERVWILLIANEFANALCLKSGKRVRVDSPDRIGILPRQGRDRSIDS